MAVERWFEREASDLRGEVKNHLNRSPFSVGVGAIRHRIWPRGRQQRRLVGMGAPDDGRVKTSPEGRRTTSLGEEGRRRHSRRLPRCVVGGS